MRKAEVGGETRTSVDALTDQARQEEIARMLAGAELTDAARVAARELMGRGRPSAFDVRRTGRDGVVGPLQIADHDLDDRLGPVFE